MPMWLSEETELIQFGKWLSQVDNAKVFSESIKSTVPATAVSKHSEVHI